MKLQLVNKLAFLEGKGGAVAEDLVEHVELLPPEEAVLGYVDLWHHLHCRA